MRKSKFDWVLIQKDYDTGMTIKEVCEKHKCSNGALFTAKGNGLFKTRILSIAVKQSKKKRRSMPNELRATISLSMKKAHADGRHPGWKGPKKNDEGRTYAEQVIFSLINKHDPSDKLGVVEKLRIKKYVLDFAFPEMKIDLEIDGMFHIIDEKTIAKDIRRDSFMREIGWSTYRISWKEMQADINGVFKKFLDFIDSPEIKDTKYDIEAVLSLYRKRQKKYGGKTQYNEFRKKNYVPRILKRKVERPEYEKLKEDIAANGYVKCGEKYGVSNNAVKKWMKCYEREKQK